MNLNLEKLIKKFGGKWVAFKPETYQVLSSGKSIQKVYKEARNKGIDIPTLFKVPSKYVPYIG